MMHANDYSIAEPATDIYRATVVPTTRHDQWKIYLFAGATKFCSLRWLAVDLEPRTNTMHGSQGLEKTGLDCSVRCICIAVLRRGPQQPVNPASP